MNNIPFSEVYWNVWFQLGGCIMFLFGWIAASLFPLLKWDYIKATHYCDVMNKLIWKLKINIQSVFYIECHNLASYMTNRLYYKSTPRYEIIWNESEERFEVKKIKRS